VWCFESREIGCPRDPVGCRYPPVGQGNPSAAARLPSVTAAHSRKKEGDLVEVIAGGKNTKVNQTSPRDRGLISYFLGGYMKNSVIHVCTNESHCDFISREAISSNCYR
jgi:hypothetical protein